MICSNGLWLHTRVVVMILFDYCMQCMGSYNDRPNRQSCDSLHSPASILPSSFAFLIGVSGLFMFPCLAPQSFLWKGACKYGYFHIADFSCACRVWGSDNWRPFGATELKSAIQPVQSRKDKSACIYLISMFGSLKRCMQIWFWFR